MAMSAANMEVQICRPICPAVMWPNRGTNSNLHREHQKETTSTAHSSSSSNNSITQINNTEDQIQDTTNNLNTIHSKMILTGNNTLHLDITQAKVRHPFQTVMVRISIHLSPTMGLMNQTIWKWIPSLVAKPHMVQTIMGWIFPDSTKNTSSRGLPNYTRRRFSL